MAIVLNGVGFLVMAVGGALAFAPTLPRPDWFWGSRDLVTGEPAPATRVGGRGLLATGLGLVLMAWLGSPAGVWAGSVAVCLMFLGAVLQIWAAKMRRAIA